ncbi:ABC transporter substrate-binding protein [Neptuniibacter sp.]|uniref:substrate-binding periplasmic protein n=1 Tax=Neptuniibacter sp. TaxID=1962643 RepID=UPI00262E83FF|nr:transporter substrate-binding domain-containing protein [Neptuniibacter sp.]MCP4596606.1 amino acid ABC transporter substrate-binding protein [Neptuniibacter sp.]
MKNLLHLFLCCFLLPSSWSWAESRTDSEVRFGTFAHPPYAYELDSGEQVGSLYEVANAILRQAGLQGKNEVLPTKRLFQQLKNGMSDCSLMIKNEITKSNFNLIEPIGEIVSTGITAKPGVRLESYDDLEEIIIAVPRGIYIYSPFDQDKSLNKVATNDYGHSAVMLGRGRVDAMAGVVESMLFNVHKQDVKVGESLIFSTYPIWMLCARDALPESTLIRLQSAVKSLREDGTIRQIFLSHAE